MSLNLSNEVDYKNWNTFFIETFEDFFIERKLKNKYEVKSYLYNLKDSAKTLWRSYRSKIVEVNYDDPLIQEAYFFRYCVLYHSTVFKVLNFVKDFYEPQTDSQYLEYSFISAGPGSEVLGFFNWIHKNFPQELETYNEITLYDKSTWGIPRRVITRALEKKLSIFEGYRINSIHKDIFEFSYDLDDTNQKIVLFQNCLNEILVSEESKEKIFFILQKISNSLVSGGMLIFIDRANYSHTFEFLNEVETRLGKKSFTQIFNQDFLSQVNESRLDRIEIPELIRNNLFTGESGLKLSLRNEIICKIFQKK